LQSVLCGKRFRRGFFVKFVTIPVSCLWSLPVCDTDAMFISWLNCYGLKCHTIFSYKLNHILELPFSTTWTSVSFHGTQHFLTEHRHFETNSRCFQCRHTGRTLIWTCTQTRIKIYTHNKLILFFKGNFGIILQKSQQSELFNRFIFNKILVQKEFEISK
jgi:hypothetical protein